MHSNFTRHPELFQRSRFIRSNAIGTFLRKLTFDSDADIGILLYFMLFSFNTTDVSDAYDIGLLSECM